MTTKGRRNHFWDAPQDREAAKTDQVCRNCGLLERGGYYTGSSGRVVHVLQWITPNGRLLGIQPGADIRPGPSRGELAVVFAGVPVIGSPQCPKTPTGWQ